MPSKTTEIAGKASSFFKEGEGYYDKFGRPVTPKQVLGIEEWKPPADFRNQMFQKAAEYKIEEPTKPAQEVASKTKPGRPEDGMKGVGFDEDMGPPTKESIDGLKKFANSGSEAALQLQNEFNDAKIPIPSWLVDVIKNGEPLEGPAHLTDFEKTGRPKRVNMGPKRPSEIYVPTLKETTPKFKPQMAGYLNKQIEADKNKQLYEYSTGN
jgi:hypothetical protein